MNGSSFLLYYSDYVQVDNTALYNAWLLTNAIKQKANPESLS